MKKKVPESAQAEENRKFIEENYADLKKRVAVKRILRATMKQNPVIRILRWLFFFCLYYPVFALLNRIIFGLKIKGKKNFRTVMKNGCITVCNHMHALDNTFCCRGIFPKKPIFTSKPANFDKKGAGMFIKALGVVPTPTGLVETRVFFHALGEMLRRGKVVHIYPEGELVPFDKELRPFQNGAFYLAAIEKKPIVPMRIIYRPRKNPNKKPRMTLIIGEPIFADESLDVLTATANLKLRTEQSMREMDKKVTAMPLKMPVATQEAGI